MSQPGEPPAFTPEPPASLLAAGVAVGGLIAGKYRVERLIGRGGMGLVLAAVQIALDRTVAIKLIRPEQLEDARAVERLLREAKATASIQSEHVARVLDVGTLDNGAPFIVMEYLEGQDLDTVLRRDGPLTTIDAVDFILEACEAIAEAHRNRIVHRDLKPANLFVSRLPGGGACIKVVDFGISKIMSGAPGESLTEASRVMGSVYHMAPEQLRGADVDARTDVWALGALLFEMMTGQKPFRDAAWPAVCAQILNEAAPDLALLGHSIPEDLRATIRRCLSRLPEERFANVAEFAVAIMPYGSRRARNSLERIVQLATSTGSLAAQALHPTTAPSEPATEVAAKARSSREAQAASPGARWTQRSGESSAKALSSDRTPNSGREHWVVGSVVAVLLLIAMLQPARRNSVLEKVQTSPAPSVSTAPLRALAEPIQAPEAVTPAAPRPSSPEAAAPVTAALAPERKPLPALPSTRKDAVVKDQLASSSLSSAHPAVAPAAVPPAAVPPAAVPAPSPRLEPSTTVPMATASNDTQPAHAEGSAAPAEAPGSAPANPSKASTPHTRPDAGTAKHAGDAWDLHDVGFE